MPQTPPDHLGHIRRPCDLDPKIFRVKLVDDCFYPADEPLTVSVRCEDDHVARASIVRNQQPFPERTLLGIFKAFGAVS